MKTHPSFVLSCSLSAMMLWFTASSASVNASQEAGDPSEKAAASPMLGDAETLFREGRACATNENGAPDYPKAVEYLRKAAEMGHPGAQNTLGCMYGLGYGVSRNLATAAQWMQKSAEQGFDRAEYNIALCCLMGKGVPKNIEQGISWLTKAAESGMSDAQALLGNIYYIGEFGITKDNDKAFQWVSKAAAQGVASAQNTLGVMHENGSGCKRDGNEAMRLFALAAEQGAAKAQSNLGRIYASNVVVPQNKVFAYQWLKLSANQGEATAVNYLKEFQLGMKPEEVAQGDRLVKAFQAKHPHKKRAETSF